VLLEGRSIGLGGLARMASNYTLLLSGTMALGLTVIDFTFLYLGLIYLYQE